MEQPQPYLPDELGFSALDMLDRVNWTELRHAYGAGVVGGSIEGDVSRSLATLRSDPPAAIGVGLYSNVCHQGTVYEATAYAVPFVAAVAAGKIPDELRTRLVILLGDIALGGSEVTTNGSRAGSFGDGVDTLLRTTISACAPYLSAIELSDPHLAPLIQAIRTLTREPSAPNRESLDELIVEWGG